MDYICHIAMIARRIYLVTKASKTSVTVHRLQFTMRILVESGFLYLTTTLAHFVVWFTPNTYAISVISGMVRVTCRCFQNKTI